MDMRNWAYWAMAAFIAAAACYGYNAKADTYIYAGAWSEHLISGDEYDYNEQHDLIGVEHNGFMAGHFVNSYGVDSQIVGYRLKREWLADVEASLILGAVRGYTTCYGDDGSDKEICPAAVPMLTYTGSRIQPTVMLFGEALAIGFRIEL